MLTIPKGQLLQIRRGGQDMVDVPLVLGETVSLDISSDFGPIINMKGNPALTALATQIPFLRDKGLSGHFAQEGFQIWLGSKPIEFSTSVTLAMQTNAKTDVLDPALTLMQMGLPTISSNNWGLIPPGPNAYAQLKIDSEQSDYLQGQGKISLRIGNYLYFSSVVVTKAVPTYKTVTDSNKVSSQIVLELGFRTTDIATTNLLELMREPTSYSEFNPPVSIGTA